MSDVRIHVEVSDTIGLPNFSSVKIGAGLDKTIQVESDDDLTSQYRDLFTYLEEEILAYEREKVLGEIQGEK